MKVEQVKINDIFPYLHNAKKHDKTQIANVAESIKQFGMVQPIVVDKDNNVIIGHCRLLACKQLKMKEVPIVKLEDLTSEEANKLRLLDNKLNESEWDLNLLAEDVPSLDFDGFDIDWGIPEVETTDEKEIIEDDAPEVPEEPISKLGDLWRLGSHRLICGDSTDSNVIDRLMDGVKADMVFTDPPYGMNLDTDYSKMNGNEGHGKKYDKGFVDDFHSEMIDAIMLMNAKETFIWGADYFAELIPNRNSGSWFVWDKRENELTGANVDKRFGSMFELCWSKEKHKREIFRFMWAGMMKQKDVDDKRYHPTQKPIKLAGWFLERYSKEGQTVVDLFGGSGSTLIACEQLNRKCYMAELDPKYVSVIIQRYINFKGSDADVFLLKDGKRIPYSEVV